MRSSDMRTVARSRARVCRQNGMDAGVMRTTSSGACARAGRSVRCHSADASDPIVRQALCARSRSACFSACGKAGFVEGQRSSRGSRSHVVCERPGAGHRQQRQTVTYTNFLRSIASRYDQTPCTRIPR